MLQGVPPYMSVRISTPCPWSSRSRAAATLPRASSKPSLQSSDSASKPFSEPEMTFAAASSSRARPPCVRISFPIIA